MMKLFDEIYKTLTPEHPVVPNNLKSNLPTRPLKLINVVRPES